MTKAQQGDSVKEHPILFSAPMIQALFAGRKTQTRRMMKPQPILLPPGYCNPKGRWSWDPNRDHHNLWEIDENPNLGDWAAWRLSMCPYGEVGDRLWIKETFFCNSFDYPEATDHSRENLYYRADGEPDMEGETIGKEGGGWKPSIFMPRWASRLTLEITGVRVEQVQSITVDDIYNEGIRPVRDGKMLLHHSPATDAAYREDWQALWDDINGKKRGASFADNPWCWVLNFRVEEAKR